MKTILKKKLVIETKKYDFDNQFSYIEVWHNSILKDCFFAEREFLYPDGTIKSGGYKYFLCQEPNNIEKQIKKINYKTFDSFQDLYFYDEHGEIKKIGE